MLRGKKTLLTVSPGLFKWWDREINHIDHPVALDIYQFIMQGSTLIFNNFRVDKFLTIKLILERLISSPSWLLSLVKGDSKCENLRQRNVKKTNFITSKY